MRSRVPAVVVAAAVLLGGCGANEHDKVKAKVQQFVQAVDARDYRTICQQVLAPVLLAHLAQAGLRCEQALQIGWGRLQSPSLTVGPISIDGARASALTLSSARGEKAALAALQLVKTPEGWRIASLGSPVPGK